MSDHRQCLNCTHYVPTAHEGWQPREYALDQPYSLYDLKNHLGDDYEPHPQYGWPGACRFNPVPVPVTSVYRCGHWVANEYMLETWGQWAAGYHRGKRERALEKELKAERKRSLARYHELRAYKRKPPNGQAHEEAEAS